MGHKATQGARRVPSAGATGSQCDIANCRTDVDQWGDTCSNVLRAFGTDLRPGAAPPLNHQQILDRDSYVDRALALQRQVRHGPGPATASPTLRRGRRA